MQTMLETWEHAHRSLEWQSRGGHTWSNMGSVQSTSALSGGESGYFALLRSCAHALGIKAMLSDRCCGVYCEIHMRCDSSTARGMSVRQGLVKTRRVDVPTTGSARRTLNDPTSENMSDTFTKSLSQADADRCNRCMNFHMGDVGSGRHLKNNMKYMKIKSAKSITKFEWTACHQRTTAAPCGGSLKMRRWFTIFLKRATPKEH